MQTKQIILATINAKYYHTSLALKYLKANLNEFESHAVINEFACASQTEEIAQKIIDQKPDIVALGVYIWNTTKIIELLPLLRKALPATTIILGGPEVSFDIDPELEHSSDYIIQGEAEISFYQLVRDLINQTIRSQKIIIAIRPDLEQIKLPYYLYDHHELHERFVMVESSRGCPYGCEFCLSALDPNVRYFPIEKITSELHRLINLKARKFKFIDRTFNLKRDHVNQILDLFLNNMHDSLFLHLEVTPTNISQELLDKIALFPRGSLQLEIGVQSLTPSVLERITRKASPEIVLKNMSQIKKSGALIHADLIIGLPGETCDEIENSFNQLYQVGPNEIQVGILKKLRGAKIKRHDQEFRMVYSEKPPYEIIQNSTLNKEAMDDLKRFAKFFELIVNRKQFVQTLNFIFISNNPFNDFWKLSDYLYSLFQRDYSISLDQLYIAIFNYLKTPSNQEELIAAMKADYLLKPRKYLPAFLKQES